MSTTLRPAGLSPQQFLILEQLRHTRGSPLPVARFVFALYGDRVDGGPDTAQNCVMVQMSNLRTWLRKHGVEILTIGGGDGYMLDPAHFERLESVLVEQRQVTIELARKR